MSQLRQIKIKDGYKDGTLKLSDNGHTHADKKDTILWTIKNGIWVESIVRIEIKPGSDNIFDGPIVNNGSTSEGKISADAAGKLYTYSIVWKNSEGGEHTYDPIISVKPSGVLENWQTKLVVGFVVGAVAFLALRFMRNNRK